MSQACAARVAARVNRRGHTVILRRITGSDHQASFDVSLKAVIRSKQPNELVGGIEQFDSVAIISNKEITERQWPGPPQQNDRLLDGAAVMTVQAVETRHDGEDVALHVLALRG